MIFKGKGAYERRDPSCKSETGWWDAQGDIFFVVHRVLECVEKVYCKINKSVAKRTTKPKKLTNRRSTACMVFSMGRLYG
jgi:hypothetical protein